MKPVKQIFQSLKDGSTEIMEIPCPSVKKGHILIKTRLSLISAGTERMLVDFGKASLIDKARSQPDKVKQVIDKIRTDGLFETMDAVMTKLSDPLPLGYSNVGEVIELGEGCEDTGFKIGDRVLSNGAHAEVVCVPKNLCALIPDLVSDENAVFGVLGAIALQGVRLFNPTLGETVIVSGIGLIGILTVQILLANGCKVIAMDFNEERLKLVGNLGAKIINLNNQDPQSLVNAETSGYGVDGVIITAATKSSEPVHQAANLSRKRGRIILVGVSGLELNRSDFYEKELTFQVSCSYGPGRYDMDYEQKGNDYPYGFVRWTEQRNFEAVLELMKNNSVLSNAMISHSFNLDEAKEAYKLISENYEPYLGIVLKYADSKAEASEKYSKQVSLNELPAINPENPTLGVIGAGNFAGRILIPALSQTNAVLKTLASQGGASSTHLGKKFGFANSSTDADSIFDDSEINTVIITTRHNTHADLVKKGLKKGKHVFVEKPLCFNISELNEIKEIYEDNVKGENPKLLMVGFNRRFSPFTVRMKKLLSEVKGSKSFIVTVNAGFIPKDHWIQNDDIGGGRIVGEVCHFIDLIGFLSGEKITNINTMRVKREPYEDTVSITMQMDNGSIGTVHYFTNGSKSFSKERVEVFCEEKVLVLDNFRELKGYGFKRFKRYKTFRQDKGHKSQFKEFIDAVQKGRTSPVSFEDVFDTMAATFAAKASQENGTIINLKDFIKPIIL